MINTFENILIEKDYGYFFSYERNGLFKVDLKKWEIELLTTFEEYPISSERLYANIVKLEDWLILIPMQADKFAAYNLNSFEKKYLAVPEIKGKYKKSAKFLSAFVFEQKVFIIGHSFPGIVKIDLNDWNSELLIDLSEKYGGIDETKDAFRYCKLLGNNIYAVSAYDDDVLIFDLCSEKSAFKTINCKTQGFATWFKCENYYVFVSQYEKVLVRYDCETGSVQEISIPDKSAVCECTNLMYSNSLEYNEFEIIIPLGNEQIVVFNRLSEKMTFVCIDEITCGFAETVAPIRSAFVYDGHIYVLSGNSGEIFEIDMLRMRLKNTKHKIMAPLEDKNVLFIENRGYGLSDYLSEFVN